jgi:aspartyl-tRNA(Asn)/glutamyl-tRNA(Gln) amidotransferase subunit C
MSLTHDEVNAIAHLARLALTDAEVEQYRQQLSAILDYADRLKELDLTAVPATASATNLRNVLRPDQAEVIFDQADLLFNAPRLEGDQFLIQTALEDG